MNSRCFNSEHNKIPNKSRVQWWEQAIIRFLTLELEFIQVMVAFIIQFSQALCICHNLFHVYPTPAPASARQSNDHIHSRRILVSVSCMKIVCIDRARVIANVFKDQFHIMFFLISKNASQMHIFTSLVYEWCIFFYHSVARQLPDPFNIPPKNYPNYSWRGQNINVLGHPYASWRLTFNECNQSRKATKNVT